MFTLLSFNLRVCVTQEGMESAGSAIGYNMSNGVHRDKYDSRVGLVEVNGGGEKLNPVVPLTRRTIIYVG